MFVLGTISSEPMETCYSTNHPRHQDMMSKSDLRNSQTSNNSNGHSSLWKQLHTPLSNVLTIIFLKSVIYLYCPLFTKNELL